jgi:hypothetical protein
VVFGVLRERLKLDQTKMSEKEIAELDSIKALLEEYRVVNTFVQNIIVT